MRTIFFVDDDGLMREMLTRLLEKNHYRVRSFASPAEALPLITTSYPDVLISDVQMPGMDGLEFARRVRERAADLPVVLVTGHLTPEVERGAQALGVPYVFQKPLKDVSHLCSVIQGAISSREEADTLAGFDQLRLNFLTGLAHELRTPLTAIKLALDSLFASRAGDLRGAHDRLLAISRRNIDRIIRLVEGQLDLLQITLGDVSVARRLVVLRDVIERAVGGTSLRARKSLIVENAFVERPIYLFSDPDRLCAVIGYVLENGAYNRETVLKVHSPGTDAEGNLVLEFESTSFSKGYGSPPGLGRGASTLLDAVGGPDGTGAEGFQARAFRRLVESLSGEMHVDDGTPERVRLVFPLIPPFDSRIDFVAPLSNLREAAMLSGKTVTLLKCDVPDGGAVGSAYSEPELSFFQKSSSVLSDGDALVRGRLDGRYCLILIDRTPDEIEHVVDFLGSKVEDESDRKGVVETVFLRTIPPDHSGDEDLLRALETVQ